MNLFNGLRVIELGQYVAAPYCAELFAHGGADVLSIEPIGGSATRFSPPGAPDGIQYVSKARGKRSLALTLNHPLGREIVRRLCDQADVLIANLRPGTATELGLDFDSLSVSNPRLIVAQLDGFGDSDEADPKACVDIVAQATSGLLSSLALDGTPEIRRDVLLADVSAGMLLAFGVSSALWHRERTGEGQLVRTSLMSAALSLQLRTAHLVGDHDPHLAALEQGRNAGYGFEELLRENVSSKNKMPVGYNIFAVRDGFVAIGAVRHNLHHLLQLADLNSDEADASSEALSKKLSHALSGLSSDRVIAHLEACGVPVGPVRFIEEVLSDPRQVELGLVEDFTHERLGRIRIPAAPVSFSGARYRVHHSTPLLGEHNEEVLSQLGYSQAEIEQLVMNGVVARQGEVDG